MEAQIDINGRGRRLIELKLKKDRFRLLDARGEKRIYYDENNSARALETMASQKDDVDTESLKMLKANKVGEELEIEPVPWSRAIMWENAKLGKTKRKPRLFNVEIRIRDSSS